MFAKGDAFTPPTDVKLPQFGAAGASASYPPMRSVGAYSACRGRGHVSELSSPLRETTQLPHSALLSPLLLSARRGRAPNWLHAFLPSSSLYRRCHHRRTCCVMIAVATARAFSGTVECQSVCPPSPSPLPCTPPISTLFCKDASTIQTRPVCPSATRDAKQHGHRPRGWR